MLRTSTIVILVAIMLVGIGDVQAQSLEWTVWVYDPEAGTVTLFGSDGDIVLDFELTMPDGYDHLSDRITVSPDGSVLAFMAENSVTDEQQLVVTEWLGAGIRGTFELGHAGAMPVTIAFREIEDTPILANTSYNLTWGFNKNALDDLDRDVTLAFGYHSTDADWQIVTFDATENTILHQLDANDPIVVDAGISGDMIIGVQRFYDETVMFTAMSSQGDAPYASYAWHTVDHTIDPIAAYPLLPPAVQTLPTTGETLMAWSDTIYAYDPQHETLFPFYRDPGATLVMPTFIQHGQRVLVLVERNGSAGFPRILNRDGTIATEGFGPGTLTDAIGVPDGVVFVASMGESTFVGVLNTETDPIEPGGAVFLFTDEPRTLQLAFVHTGIAMPDTFDPLAELPSSTSEGE